MGNFNCISCKNYVSFKILSKGIFISVNKLEAGIQRYEYPKYAAMLYYTLIVFSTKLCVSQCVPILLLSNTFTTHICFYLTFLIFFFRHLHLNFTSVLPSEKMSNIQGGQKLFTTFQTYINHSFRDIRKWIALFERTAENFSFCLPG